MSATHRQIVLEGPRAFGVRAVETPEPGAGDAVVRIGLVGVCGSDLHLYRSGEIGGVHADFPCVIGHECMGTVAAVGPGVDPALEGRRVAVEPHMTCGRCRWCLRGLDNVCPEGRFLGLPPVAGAMQDLLVHPAHLLEPLPDAVSDAAAVVLEPMAIALHALRLAKVEPGMDVAILGTGVLGTCVLHLLSLYRGLRIVCVDLLEDRLERARELGAAATVQAEAGSRGEAVARVLDASGGKGAEAVFECAGVPDTFAACAEVAAPAGHVALIGIPDDATFAIAAAGSRRKGLTLRLVRRSLHTLRPCLELAERGAIDPQSLATHTFPAADSGEAYACVDGYRDGVLKALVDFH